MIMGPLTKKVKAQKIIKCLEKLDPITMNHSIRVMMICAEIESYMGLTKHNLRNAALLHDIGKMYVSPNILNKNGRLTYLERELIDLHPYIGYNILNDLGVQEEICKLVLHHHGVKPFCINNDKIESEGDDPENNQMAAILQTVDSFEALTSDRSYRRGWTCIDAIHIMSMNPIFHPVALGYIQKAANGAGIQNSVVRRSESILSMDEVENMVYEMDL